jgi:hypothetical protein
VATAQTAIHVIDLAFKTKRDGSQATSAPYDEAELPKLAHFSST